MEECSQLFEESINEGFLEVLKCVACRELLDPPIQQCVQGHCVCQTCRETRVSCPVCREKLTSTRNLLAEELSQKIPRSCINSAAGCQVKHLSSNLIQHEMACPYRPYGCPVGEDNSCTWKGRRKMILLHCKQYHKEFILTEGFKRLFWHNPSFERRRYRCFILSIDNELFWYYFIVEPTSRSAFFFVQFIGPKEKACSYRYRLQYESQDKVQQLTFTNWTHSDDIDIKMIMKSRTCLELSEGFAQYFIHCGLINSTLIIEKVHSDGRFSILK